MFINQQAKPSTMNTDTTDNILELKALQEHTRQLSEQLNIRDTQINTLNAQLQQLQKQKLTSNSPTPSTHTHRTSKCSACIIKQKHIHNLLKSIKELKKHYFKTNKSISQFTNTHPNVHHYDYNFKEGKELEKRNIANNPFYSLEIVGNQMGVSVNRGEEFRGTDGEGEGEIRDQGYQKQDHNNNSDIINPNLHQNIQNQPPSPPITPTPNPPTNIKIPKNKNLFDENIILKQSVNIQSNPRQSQEPNYFLQNNIEIIEIYANNCVEYVNMSEQELGQEYEHENGQYQRKFGKYWESSGHYTGSNILNGNGYGYGYEDNEILNENQKKILDQDYGMNIIPSQNQNFSDNYQSKKSKEIQLPKSMNTNNNNNNNNNGSDLHNKKDKDMLIFSQENYQQNIKNSDINVNIDGSDGRFNQFNRNKDMLNYKVKYLEKRLEAVEDANRVLRSQLLGQIDARNQSSKLNLNGIGNLNGIVNANASLGIGSPFQHPVMQHSLALAPTQPVAFVNPIPLHALAPIAITPPVQVPTLTISPSPKLAVPLSALSPIYNQQQLQIQYMNQPSPHPSPTHTNTTHTGFRYISPLKQMTYHHQHHQQAQQNLYQHQHQNQHAPTHNDHRNNEPFSGPFQLYENTKPSKPKSPKPSVKFNLNNNNSTENNNDHHHHHMIKENNYLSPLSVFDPTYQPPQHKSINNNNNHKKQRQYPYSVPLQNSTPDIQYQKRQSLNIIPQSYSTSQQYNYKSPKNMTNNKGNTHTHININTNINTSSNTNTIGNMYGNPGKEMINKKQDLHNKIKKLEEENGKLRSTMKFIQIKNV